MSVNDRQVAGSHYRSKIQHWDFVEKNGLRYIEGCATKYVTRWRGKHKYPELLRSVVRCFGFELPTPKEDLTKSVHYIEKMIELHEEGLFPPLPMGCQVISVVNFAKANDLTVEETAVLDLLGNWEEVDQLRQALTLIATMLESTNE